MQSNPNFLVSYTKGGFVLTQHVVVCCGSNNSFCTLLKNLFGAAFTKTVIDNTTIIVITIRGNNIVSSEILNDVTSVPRFWNKEDHAKLPRNVQVSGVADGVYVFLRHPESAKNVAHSSVAILDPKITERGADQLVRAIALLRSYLAAHGLKITHIFSSLLTRTIQTAAAISEAFDVPQHYAVLWLQEFMRRMSTPHHDVGASAPASSAVALSPFHPLEKYREYNEICIPETLEQELEAMRDEITFSPSGKEEFPRLNMSLALKQLENPEWAVEVVSLNLLEWISRTVQELDA